MFFTLSKVLWVLADPANLLLIFLVLGMLLLWTPWRRGGRRLMTLSTLALLALAVFPVGQIVLQSLENRIPPPKELPAEIGGIVVLGGMIDQFVSQARGQASMGTAVERLTEFAALARRYPDAKLIFTGGSGNLIDQTVKEADEVRPFLESLGLDTTRVLFEGDSRNTYENAVYSKQVGQPSPEQPWILITSAFHMPRALGCFRETGWTVIPYPVDYGTTGTMKLQAGFNLLTGLGNGSLAVHEWLGLMFYYLTDRTNTLYPAL
ncbi:MAG: hypothetical protein K0Q70_1682 [Rhodospirillales bacterium]|nr:hypothetical protein [Rhodospirillales bacterium]